MTNTGFSPQLPFDDGLRAWANILKLWRFCGNAACRRPRCCRGKVRVCFARNFPLLPESVRDWMLAICAAKGDGLSFDQAMAFLEGSVEEDALRDWAAAVHQSLGEVTPYDPWMPRERNR